MKSIYERQENLVATPWDKTLHSDTDDARNAAEFIYERSILGRNIGLDPKSLVNLGYDYINLTIEYTKLITPTSTGENN